MKEENRINTERSFRKSPLCSGGTVGTFFMKLLLNHRHTQTPRLSRSARKHNYANGNAESFMHNKESGEGADSSQGLTKALKERVEKKRREKR